MYIKFKQSDVSYEYFDVLCWCGNIWEAHMINPTDEDFMCVKCLRTADFEDCEQLTIEEWDRVTDFEEFRDCHDCGAGPGQNHTWGCDTERCPLCGGQLLSCGCYQKMEDYEESVADGGYISICPEEEHRLHDILEIDTGLIPHDGEWPGTKECRLYNLYCHARDREIDGPGDYWMVCSPDDPRAREDLNTLYEKTVWNKNSKHRVMSERFREEYESNRTTDGEMG